MNKEEVFNELCEEGIKITGIDIRNAPRRKKENIHLRASIMVILMNYFGVTTTSAGKLFNRDHTTAVHHRAITNGGTGVMMSTPTFTTGLSDM